MLGFIVAGKSGGHLNPAVTLANCLYRGHPWRKFPVYFMGQLLGAMCGAFIVYGNYYHAINNFEGGSSLRTVTGPTATAGIFCTYPAEFMTRESMWWSEFFASSLLIFVIFALVDPKNGNVGPFMPISLFFLIFGIGACFGWETGYAINLARDFGPRLVTYIVGYGHEVWSAGGYYFWVSSRVANPLDQWSRETNNCRSRSRWLLRSVVPRLAASCTIPSSSPAPAPSTRLGWVSSVSPSPLGQSGRTRTRPARLQKFKDKT